MGAVSGIPYSEMLVFVDEVIQIDDPEDREFVLELIDFLDNEFLSEVAEKHKKDQQAQAQKQAAALPPG